MIFDLAAIASAILLLAFYIAACIKLYERKQKKKQAKMDSMFRSIGVRGIKDIPKR